MKNIFKRKEKKVLPKDGLETKNSNIIELHDDPKDSLELQSRLEFLESDEDLGYC